jgi:hypothetical protein
LPFLQRYSAHDRPRFFFIAQILNAVLASKINASTLVFPGEFTLERQLGGNTFQTKVEQWSEYTRSYRHSVGMNRGQRPSNTQ